MHPHNRLAIVEHYVLSNRHSLAGAMAWWRFFLTLITKVFQTEKAALPETHSA